jgi:uncharacterized membrane protein YGL010W
MKTAQEWFDAYGVSHQNKTNKLIHWVCIPLIMFSLFGLLMSIPVPGEKFSLVFNFASLVLIFALVFYFRLSLSLFFGFLVVGSAMLIGNYYLLETLGSHGILALVSVALFVIAWIGQFIGHKIEGAKPSFFEDLQFLMIGPAWLLQFIYKKIGLGI